jgi:hypothetical protein
VLKLAIKRDFPPSEEDLTRLRKKIAYSSRARKKSKENRAMGYHIIADLD